MSAKSVKTDTSLERTEEYTFFQGKKSPFSMQYETTFVLKGKLFRSVDQYLYYKKAILFNDIDNAQKILETLQPGEQKKIATQIKGVDQYRWTKHSPDFLYEANRAKFVQHPELLEQLFATRGTHLVEADPNDKIYGIGMGMSNEEKYDPAKWKGENQLGKMLTHLREDLFSGLEMNKIIAQWVEQFIASANDTLPEDQSAWINQIVEEIKPILATRSQIEPKDIWSITAEDASAPISFFIIHETDFETFKYPLSVRILRAVDGNYLDNEIAYWQDIETIENAIATRSRNLHKGYHLAFTLDPYFIAGNGNEPHPFSIQQDRDRAMGTLVMRVDDTEQIVTLRGQYKTDKWTIKGQIHHLSQQILPAQWK
jgi:ribA/ribD-fused uncharacterized protein